MLLGGRAGWGDPSLGVVCWSERSWHSSWSTSPLADCTWHAATPGALQADPAAHLPPDGQIKGPLNVITVSVGEADSSRLKRLQVAAPLPSVKFRMSLWMSTFSLSNKLWKWKSVQSGALQRLSGQKCKCCGDFFFSFTKFGTERFYYNQRIKHEPTQESGDTDQKYLTLIIAFLPKEKRKSFLLLK